MRAAGEAVETKDSSRNRFRRLHHRRPVRGGLWYRLRREISPPAIYRRSRVTPTVAQGLSFALPHRLASSNLATGPLSSGNLQLPCFSGGEEPDSFRGALIG